MAVIGLKSGLSEERATPSILDSALVFCCVLGDENGGHKG